MASEQRCGTCKWWTHDEYGWSYRDCNVPIPISVSHYKRDTTSANDGTDCRAFEPKEPGRAADAP